MCQFLSKCNGKCSENHSTCALAKAFDMFGGYLCLAVEPTGERRDSYDQN